ncbi:putative TIM8-translocase of the mitochondrial inner membrane [Exidia glandulosa HHB12029]|uniref:Mitochondrial import inner membrane translocase subunit n=1 Tax=Exidia glandulosa HHB12029 TaxID=1314781 RepID=A0A165IZW5_EXIGL|nr:putative TIM8-translocase of the mitochondrial inner membrane [Exidia glandulosa HHB12029]
MSTPRFDEATQKELQQFLDREQANMRMQSTIHTFTEMCWDKCITGSSFGRFSSKEEQCLSSCVERFLDTSLFIVKRIRNLPRE